MDDAFKEPGSLQWVSSKLSSVIKSTIFGQYVSDALASYYIAMLRVKYLRAFKVDYRSNSVCIEPKSVTQTLSKY